MTRLMYDSVTPENIPANAQLVAGYVDGHFAWSASAWNRFSGVRVRIAVFAHTNDGDVLDSEPGNATPQQCPGWVAMRRRSGHPRPTVYCDRSDHPRIVAAMNAQGVAQPDYWIATLDGTKNVPGAVAVQYVDKGPFDLSIVYDDGWPHRLPAPPLPPEPPENPEEPVPALAGLPVSGGSTGAAVTAVQARLRARGWVLAVDGIFGTRTTAVVDAFQHQVGLVPDGIVGEDTWEALWLAPITP